MDNVIEFPKDKIVRAKAANLVLIYQSGLPGIIGQKYGREIRKPLYIKVSEMVAGKVTYSFSSIPFAQSSIFIEGSYMFYFLENTQIQEAYQNLILPILRPE